jgi:hypothetical protein
MKRSLVVEHRPLHEYLERPTVFGASNGCLSDRQNRALSLTLAAAFLAHSEDTCAEIAEGPAAWPQLSDAVAFRDAIIQHLISLGVASPLHPLKQGGVGDYLDYVSTRFHRSRRGRCPATVSVVGALASQEVIKAVTGVHTPLSQMLFFESLDSLPEEDDVPAGEDASNMQLVYGIKVASMLQRQRLFVVGAGAIGCELLKNLALMEAASGGETVERVGGLWATKGLAGGGVVLADMDSIEKSNLNRQLLFRPQHIGESKAETAAVTARHINPSLKVWGVNAKVSLDSSIFDHEFWTGTEIVLAALDNVDARRFVDSMCVRYGCCMLGNTM